MREQRRKAQMKKKKQKQKLQDNTHPLFPLPHPKDRAKKKSKKMILKRIFFSKNLLAKEIKLTEISINKPVNLGLSILEISKIVIHEFWYN